jgi:glycosyltransferase involved in cell wall biosynthesis
MRTPGAMAKRVKNQPVRVLLMDLVSMVPYYVGHLCAALTQTQEVDVTIGSITYRHDRSFFNRAGLQNDPGFLDVTSRIPNAFAPVRGLLKVFECLVNMASWAFRFLLRRPHIIHIHFMPLLDYHLPFELWFLRLAHGLGIRLVYTVHNVLPQDTGERHRAAYERVYKLIDRFICHDLPAKARLESDFHVDPARVSIIPHGPLFKPQCTTTPDQARASAGLPANTCIVLWQGIVRPYKGISFLLKAWKLAQETGSTGVLVIVGTGEKNLLRSIEDEVSSLGIQSSVRLEFRFVSIEELSNFYQAADILVYPYSEVTTSGALMTGVGYGKAVIASALPNFEQVLRHEDNALLVKYGDVENLAAALLRMSGDFELRQRLAQRLQASQSDGPNWDDIAQLTLQCYCSALSPTPALNDKFHHAMAVRK